MDGEWLDNLEMPESNEESEELYGIGLDELGMFVAFMRPARFDFVLDGEYRIYWPEYPEMQGQTTPSWSVRGDWIITSETDSIWFEFINDDAVIV